MNGTNKTVRLKRRCPVGRLREAGIVSSIELANRDNYRISDKELEGVTVPKDFGRDLMPLLRKNRDLFTNADKYLGVTNTVKMSIDTECHPPIKKAPYRTPLKQIALVDQAIDEMLEAGIIEKSNVTGIVHSPCNNIFYHPQSNGKVERIHRTMNDTWAKKIGDNPYSWDIYINQMFVAIGFHPSESMFSPFYQLYSCEVILPLDNLLRPRRKYQGDDYHEIALQEQHRAFTSVRENLRKARKQQMHKP